MTVLLLVSGTAGLCHAQKTDTTQKKIFIRLNNNSARIRQNPLIIIDGHKQLWGGESSLNGLDAEDIKSISVLKDSSAVATYGFAAKNGVILVTTKSGIDKIISQKYQANEPLHGDISGISIRGKNKNTATFSLGNSSDVKNKPLYIIDGKEMTEDEAKNISPDSIESISVLKDGSAVTLHGDKGKNGVIIIKTKNSKKN